MADLSVHKMLSIINKNKLKPVQRTRSKRSDEAFKELNELKKSLPSFNRSHPYNSDNPIERNIKRNSFLNFTN